MRSIKVTGVAGEAKVEFRGQLVFAIHLEDERGNQVCFNPSQDDARKWAEAIWPSPPNQEISRIVEGVLLAEILMMPQVVLVTASNILAGPPVEVSFHPYQALELSMCLAHPPVDRLHG